MAEIEKSIQIQQKSDDDTIKYYPVTKWDNIENKPEIANVVNFEYLTMAIEGEEQNPVIPLLSDTEPPGMDATSIIKHIDDKDNPHQVTLAQIGGEAEGAADTVQSNLDTAVGTLTTAINSSKVTVNNTLTSTSTTEALSAAQGKALQDNKLNLSGGTLTGALTLPASNPSADNQAARKAYVDTKADKKISGTGDILNTGWTTSGNYVYRDLTTTGVVAADAPHVSINITNFSNKATNDLILEAWNTIVAGVAQAGSIRFYATVIPSVSIPVYWEVTR